ncbi:hypothetical protein PC119_g18473, partial [Phytophthora cactorum]
GALGDYFGEMRVEAPGQLVIFLETFNWSLEDGTPSYHVRSCIEFHRNGRLSVSGDILVTTGSSTFTAEEIPYVGEMTLRAKRKSVEKASARRYHAADGRHVTLYTMKQVRVEPATCNEVSGFA